MFTFADKLRVSHGLIIVVDYNAQLCCVQQKIIQSPSEVIKERLKLDIDNFFQQKVRVPKKNLPWRIGYQISL